MKPIEKPTSIKDLTIQIPPHHTSHEPKNDHRPIRSNACYFEQTKSGTIKPIELTTNTSSNAITTSAIKVERK